MVGCATDVVEADGEDVDLSEEAMQRAQSNTEGWKDVPELTAEERATILAKYAGIEHQGIRDELYEKAILYYDTNYARIPNKAFLGVLDFGLHSGKKRFFVMDMSGGPLKSHVVAHGKNSDPDYDGNADSFSNVNGSNKSSLGYYYVAEPYFGANGESMRLDGLSATNSNVRVRAIVIHGADYVETGRPKQGRSLGCPAFPHPDMPELIARLKNGSNFYASN